MRVSIKGGAAARAEVRERRDGTVEVTYTAPMSGEYRIALGVGAVAIGTYRAQCAPPRPSEALSRVPPSLLSQTSIHLARPNPFCVTKKLACIIGLELCEQGCPKAAAASACQYSTTLCGVLEQAESSHRGDMQALLNGQLLIMVRTKSSTSVQVRMASASSAFVGERYAVVCEVLDQFGGCFSGDPKCGTTAEGTLL